MRFNGKEIEITDGDMKGAKGYYLGTDGYTGGGVTCKLLIDNKPYSFLWSYFLFTDPSVQEAFNDEDLIELDFPE